MFLIQILIICIIILYYHGSQAHQIGTRNINSNNDNRRRRLTRQQQQQSRRNLLERPMLKSSRQPMDTYFPCNKVKAGGASKGCVEKPTPSPTSQPTLPPTPSPPTELPTSEPTLSPTKSTSIIQPSDLPELQVIENNNGARMGVCTGNCKNNGDCFDDLDCYLTDINDFSSSSSTSLASALTRNQQQPMLQENTLAQVPGCAGFVSLNDMNPVHYCYNRNWNVTDVLMNIGNNGMPSRSYPLSLCQADCDSDDECQEGLICFQRSALEPVPGCPKGELKGGNDYCIDPSALLNPTSTQPITAPFSTPVPMPVPAPAAPTSTNAPQEPQPSNDDDDDDEISYQPGNFSLSQRSPDGSIRLSNGLGAELLAVSGEFVPLANGNVSAQEFHIAPDGAAVFDSGKYYGDDGEGWYYVSNAENETSGRAWTNGGVGALEFNGAGEVVGYKRIASRLRMNCGGGRTPWNSWITCEEIVGGKIHQIDPAGKIPRNRTALGTLGIYESFSYDLEANGAIPTFYVTRDAHNGALTRFTPNDRGMECFRKTKDEDRWCTLNYGSIDYLFLGKGVVDDRTGTVSGNFTWTTSLRAAKQNSEALYPHAEGIDSYQGFVYFTSKRLKRLVVLNLRDLTFKYETTVSGAFNEQPDQVARILTPNHSNEVEELKEHAVALTNEDEFNSSSNDILYFCEDGGRRATGPGIHGRTMGGRYFTVLYADRFQYASETTGLAYSPTGHDMYVSFQESGRIYRFYREDGYPFQGAMLDIKYHAE